MYIKMCQIDIGIVKKRVVRIREKMDMCRSRGVVVNLLNLSTCTTWVQIQYGPCLSNIVVSTVLSINYYVTDSQTLDKQRLRSQKGKYVCGT